MSNETAEEASRHKPGCPSQHSATWRHDREDDTYKADFWLCTGCVEGGGDDAA